ncbi:MAG: insulinase family protein [Bacteroidales bacterium]|nr:insulinase family protein [Bacteroidales bacterium]
MPIQTDTAMEEIPMQPIANPINAIINQLSNGLTYYIVHQEGQPGQADFYLVQRTGSLVEEDGQEGVAHMVEHMLFCGTKHFSEQQMLDYFRSIGLDWGNELNAETDFNRTIYKLTNVPISSNSRADSCLLLLRDWAGDALLPADKLERERTIILEEKRQRHNSPYEGEYWKSMYPDSRYTHRLSIGHEEVIRNVSIKELRDFYHKWYQPQHQAVIVVGDINDVYIEKKIKKLFGTLKRGKTNLPELSVHVEKRAEPRVVSHPVPGRTNVGITLNYQIPAPTEREPYNTLQWYVRCWIYRLIPDRWVLRMRRRMRDSDYLYGATGDFKRYDATGDTPIAYNTTMKSSMWREGLTAMVQEYMKILRYGWSRYEAGHGQPYILEGNGSFPEIEEWPTTSYKEYRQNYNYRNHCINHFLYGEPLDFGNSGQTMRYYIEKHLNAAQAYQHLLRTDNDSLLTIIMDVPADTAFHCPTAQEVLAVYQKARKGDYYESRYQYAYDRPSEDVLDTIPVDVTPGTIVETRQLPFAHASMLTLSNGITLYFVEDQSYCCFSLRGYRPGGLFQYSGDDYWRSRYFETAPKLPFETDRSFSYNVTHGNLQDEFHFFNNKSCDLYDAFYKMCYITLTNTDIDSTKLCQQIASRLENLEGKNMPSPYANNVLDSLILADPSRFSNWTRERYQLLSYPSVHELYKQYKQNFNGTVMAVRSFTPLTEHISYIEKYLASLPALAEPVKYPECPDLLWKDQDILYSDTLANDTINAYCDIFYNQNDGYQYTRRNCVLLQAFARTLKQLLENKLRLELGNIYSVNCSQTTVLHPYPHQYLNISFSCSPQHIQQCIARTDSIVKEMAYGSILTQPLLDNWIHANEKWSLANQKYDSGLAQHLLNNNTPDANTDYDWTLIHDISLEDLRSFIAQMLENSHRYEYVRMPRSTK